MTHRHSHADALCTPDCPVWHQDARQERWDTYHLRGHLEETFRQWFLIRTPPDWMALRTLRQLQREAPNRRPSR